MRNAVRGKLEAAARARDLCRAHPFEDPAHVTIMTSLEDRISTAEQLAVEEQTGRRVAAGATRSRQALRQKLYDQLRVVARSAIEAGKELPELEAQLEMVPSNLGHLPLISRGWAFLGIARANLEVLARHGLAATTLDTVATLLTRYEAEAERSNAGRTAHVGARAQLMKTSAEIQELIELLHALNVSRFRNDAKALAAWHSARNVVADAQPEKAELPAPEPVKDTPPATPDATTKADASKGHVA